MSSVNAQNSFELCRKIFVSRSSSIKWALKPKNYDMDGKGVRYCLDGIDIDDSEVNLGSFPYLELCSTNFGEICSVLNIMIKH